MPYCHVSTLQANWGAPHPRQGQGPLHSKVPLLPPSTPTSSMPRHRHVLPRQQSPATSAATCHVIRPHGSSLVVRIGVRRHGATLKVPEVAIALLSCWPLALGLLPPLAAAAGPCTAHLVPTRALPVGVNSTCLALRHVVVVL